MSLKTVYFYQVNVLECATKSEMDIGRLKALINSIVSTNRINDSVRLSRQDDEPIIMDIIEDAQEYLFFKLSKKRLNNNLDKRDYGTLKVTDVLDIYEIDKKGIESYTYCILGYKHGILSLVSSSGAPGHMALNRLFELYNSAYMLEMLPIPNTGLIDKLYSSDNSEIDKIFIEIPTISGEALEKLFGFGDEEIIEILSNNTNTIGIELRPEPRGQICDDSSVVKKIISSFRRDKSKFKKIILTAKTSSAERQLSYDLYEEFFKYSINVPDFRSEGGRKVEVPKAELRERYQNSMKDIYDEFKTFILMVCDRL